MSKLAFPFAYSCNSREEVVSPGNPRAHCLVCEDHDLCMPCYAMEEGSSRHTRHDPSHSRQVVCPSSSESPGPETSAPVLSSLQNQFTPTTIPTSPHGRDTAPGSHGPQNSVLPVCNAAPPPYGGSICKYPPLNRMRPATGVPSRPLEEQHPLC